MLARASSARRPHRSSARVFHTCDVQVRVDHGHSAAQAGEDRLQEGVDSVELAARSRSSSLIVSSSSLVDWSSSFIVSSSSLVDWSSSLVVSSSSMVDCSSSLVVSSSSTVDWSSS